MPFKAIFTKFILKNIFKKIMIDIEHYYLLDMEVNQIDIKTNIQSTQKVH